MTRDPNDPVHNLLAARVHLQTAIDTLMVFRNSAKPAQGHKARLDCCVLKLDEVGLELKLLVHHFAPDADQGPKP